MLRSSGHTLIPSTTYTKTTKVTTIFSALTLDMLRRQATTIKLTPEDVLEYDDSLMSTAQGNERDDRQAELQEQINNSSELISYKERDVRVGVNR